MPTASSLALLVAGAEATGVEVKPLTAESILVALAIIAVVCAAIVLAGFGYFTPGSGDDSDTPVY